MTIQKINYKGFEIQKRTDVKTHCVTIFKNNKLFACVAGDIALDGSENSIEKAKLKIDNL